jgi:glycosyltransferase involved in cell wall biosynthesis
MYLPDLYGGTETTTHETCLMLLERGIYVAVLAAAQGKNCYEPTNRVRCQQPGPLFAKDHIMGYPVYRGRNFTDGIAEVCEDFQPTVAVVKAGYAMEMIRLLLEQGIPTVVYFFDYLFTSAGWHPIEDERARYVANSKFIGDWAEKLHGVKSTIIPTLIQPDRYRVKPQPDFVTFINPVPEKGLSIALELARRNPKTPFQFVAGWPVTDRERQDLFRQLAGLPNIKYLPNQSDMRRVYGTSKLVIMPSQWKEPFGRVPIEASFSGIPAIASRVGGLPEAVGDGGVLIDPYDDVEVWNASLVDLWTNDNSYLRAQKAAIAASKRAEIQPKNVLKNFLEVLESV